MLRGNSKSGFAMKCIATFAVIALTITCFSFTTSARAQDTQGVTIAVKALAAQESEMWRNKDAVGVASLFTADAVLVMLARGRLPWRVSLVRLSVNSKKESC